MPQWIPRIYFWLAAPRLGGQLSSMVAMLHFQFAPFMTHPRNISQQPIHMRWERMLARGVVVYWDGWNGLVSD